MGEYCYRGECVVRSTIGYLSNSWASYMVLMCANSKLNSYRT